jgi:uncharacterized BrkB/YihY/UPF0761 family membrane protein
MGVGSLKKKWLSKVVFRPFSEVSSDDFAFAAAALAIFACLSLQLPLSAIFDTTRGAQKSRTL